MNPVRLLPFPPPWRTALALSDDIDNLLDPVRWWDFLRFLNTASPTPWGPGLDLEVGESFWFYSDDPEGQPGSWFRGRTTEPSPFAPLFGALGRSGHLDSLHSYGNFSRWGGFHRGMTDAAAEALRNEGFAPTVWINHGGAHDFQNLWSGCGDLPENAEAAGAPTPEYHLDLTWALGLRYAWIGELTTIPGQDRAVGPGDWLAPESPLRRETLMWLARGLSRRIAWREALALGLNPDPRANRLLQPRRMRDGRTVQTFRRVGDFARAKFADLAWLLRPRFLDAMERSGGMSVLFVHWNTHPGRRFDDPDPAAMAALRELARRAREKRILVTTTGRLLAYAEARGAVRIAAASAEKVDLAADPLPDGRSLAAADLAGLAFRVPAGSLPAFTFRGTPVAVERCAGTGDAVWIPRAPLVFPDPPPGIA